MASLLFLAALPGAALRAQSNPAPGSLDTDFAGSLSQISAYALAVDSQQRVIVGADNFVLDRFLPSGVVDPNFSLANFGNNSRIIFGLAIDFSDKIIVVGKFNRGGTGDNAENITRLNDDGSLDGNFNPGIGTNNTIVAVAVQPDATTDVISEKIIIGGLFTTFNGEERGRLARLNENGTLDATFDPDLSFSGDVFTIALDRSPTTGFLNGSILVGGSYDEVNESGPGRLTRLNGDGTVDATFAPEVGGSVFAIAVQPDGKIIIGGDFEEVNGVQALGLARLNPNGSLDTSFDAGVTENDNRSVPPTAVYTLAIQENGRIIVGGNFLELNGVTRRFIGRLEANGSLDESFDPGTNVANRAEALAIVPGDFENNVVDKIYVAQFVSKRINNVYPFVAIRLNGDPQSAGTADVSISVRRDGLTAGKPGVFQVERVGGDLTQPLTVYYELTKPNKAGRAVSGVDFVALSGSVVIPANQTTAKIKIVGINNVSSATAERTVGLRLVSPPATGTDYDISGVGKASIRVLANQ